MSDRRDLELVLASGTPLIVIETTDETRVLELLRDIAVSRSAGSYRPLFRWSITDGLQRLDLDLEAQRHNADPEEALRHIRAVAKPGVYALLDYKGGHKLFNLQERNRCQGANDNCWRVNDPAARFALTAQDSLRRNWRELAVYRSASISPEWIQDASFTKLREVSLTIDVPGGWVRRTGAQSASLILSGRNLGLWTDYEGADPEVNSYGGRNFVRVDAYAAPSTRRFSAAINLQY